MTIDAWLKVHEEPPAIRGGRLIDGPTPSDAVVFSHEAASITSCSRASTRPTSLCCWNAGRLLWRYGHRAASPVIERFEL